MKKRIGFPAVFTVVVLALSAFSVSAENISGLSFTRPMDLKQYDLPDVKNPWVLYTGWSSDNGILKGEDSITYCYAAVVAVDSKDVATYGEEAMDSNYRSIPEEIDVKCQYNSGIYAINDLDKDGWIDYFKDESNKIYRSANIISTNFEKYNGVDFFRIDFTLNGIQEIVLYAPSESGELFSFRYMYKPSTNVAQKFEQDFRDVLDTVSLKQKSPSAPSGEDVPPTTGKTGRGGKKTTTTDDGMVIVEYLWDDTIKLYVNDGQITPDTSPIIVNGRTLVPIRAVAEKLGYSVSWFEESQTVSMQNGSDLVQLSIGSDSLYHNSANIIIDVAPMIYESRTYLPVRAVTEAMGCGVKWNEEEKAVYITK